MDPVVKVEETFLFQSKVTLIKLLFIVYWLHSGILVAIFIHSLHNNKTTSIEFQLRLNDTGNTFSRISSLLISLLRLYS